LSSIPFSFPALDFLVETHNAGFEDGMLFFSLTRQLLRPPYLEIYPQILRKNPKMKTDFPLRYKFAAERDVSQCERIDEHRNQRVLNGHLYNLI
jgi:hypothetical protein